MVETRSCEGHENEPAAARKPNTREAGQTCLSVMNDRSLAGIDPHFAEIGRAGLSRLHTLVVGNDFRVSCHARKLLVAGSWVDGDSLPDRAG